MGAKNNNYRTGKVCYTNGTICKYLLPEQIEEYTSLGWYKGTLRKPLTKEQRDNISRGTIKESAEEYVLDKKIVHSIIHKKNIIKYDFNKSLKEMDFVIGQKSQNLAYKQVRVYGRTIWAYVIDKELFKKAVEEIENGR